MLQNNNKEVIKRLVKRSLKVNKLRNIFAILAIALTTLLITTVVVGGITFYNINKVYLNVSAYGIDCDGYLNINESTLDKLKSISNIDTLGVTQLASLDIIKNKELLNEQVVLEYADSKIAYEMMAIVPIEGSYPKDSEDILAPTWFLELLGVEKNIGEKITLDIVINNEVKKLDLKVCGYYDSLVSRGNGRTKVFVSDKFISKYNKDIINLENTKTAFLTLKNINDSSSYDTVKSEFKKISNEIGASKAKVHPKYDIESGSAISNGFMKQSLAVGVGILLVIFTGYLIIYNIFYISVSRDIKFYGLLKTIGTTSKQIKKIIIRQALILSVIGIPIGLVLGYVLATFILPIALSFTVFANIIVISKSPYIFILSILFSLITVIISCNKPGEMAGKVSPIEAVRYVSFDANSSKKNSKNGINGAKLHKMAWSNIIKSKRRVILSVISISLSAIIVIFTINASFGINPEAHAKSQTVSDVSINNYISHFMGSEKYQPINEELINKVKALDIVEDTRNIYSAILPDEDGIIRDFGVDIFLEGKLKEEVEIAERLKKNYIYYHRLNISENLMNANVTAINANRLEKEIEKLTVIDGEINEEKFKDGNYIIYYTGVSTPHVLKSGDKIPFTFRIPDKNGNIKEIKNEFEIMAIVADTSGEWSASNLENFNIEEEVFKEIFPDYKNHIKSVNIDLKDNVDIKEADDIISDIIGKSGNSTLSLSSKNFFIEGMKELKLILLIVGGIVSAILGLIGAINVANTILTSIISRRVEVAMLESIGMTKKQVKKMIVFEGLYYILLTSVLIIPLGFIAAYIAPMLVPIYSVVSMKIYLISVIIAILIIAILMITVPLVAYKLINKESLVERLRIVE